MTNPLERVRGVSTLPALPTGRPHAYARPLQAFRLADFASDDYLGFARDPQVASAAALAALNWGAGATTPHTTGTNPYAELEAALARYLDAPGSLLFSSNQAANQALLRLISGPEVLLITDEHNHSSLQNACALSDSRCVAVKHHDWAAVERALAHRSEYHAIVAVDAVFFATGELAPIRELHALVRRHSAFLLVDETHAFGVVGKGGRGAVCNAGLGKEANVIRTLSLAAALGSQGGVVLANVDIVEALADTARSFTCDTTLAAPAMGAALASLRGLMHQPDLALQARARAGELAWLAHAAGLAAHRPDAAILAIPAPDTRTAHQAERVCAEHGVRVSALGASTMSGGQAFLRLAARATVTEAELSAVARALHAVTHGVF